MVPSLFSPGDVKMCDQVEVQERFRSWTKREKPSKLTSVLNGAGSIPLQAIASDVNTECGSPATLSLTEKVARSANLKLLMSSVFHNLDS